VETFSAASFDVMGDLEKILFTSALTILGGVIVFVVGQLLSKFLIEPVQELRKVIGEVRFTLSFHAPTILTPIARTPGASDKAHEALMKCSCDLLVRAEAIPFYRLVCWASLRFVPEKKKVADAAKSLRGLSTYMYETGENAHENLSEINGRINRIEDNLGISSLIDS
jgi:hypothetical protein